ncbi:hypothetical protein D3C80_1489070 [compost metagenome]
MNRLFRDAGFLRYIQQLLRRNAIHSNVCEADWKAHGNTEFQHLVQLAPGSILKHQLGDCTECHLLAVIIVMRTF